MQVAATKQLQLQVREAERRLEFLHKGVDLCIMMDCTGSIVGSWFTLWRLCNGHDIVHAA
jgi:hypothetical protein